MVIRFLLCLLGMLACVGSLPPRPVPDNSPFATAYQRIMQLGAARRWHEMVALGETQLKKAEAADNLRYAAVFSYAVSQGLFHEYQYSKALQAAIRGRQYALRARRWQSAAVNSYAISKIYQISGNDLLALNAGWEMIRQMEMAGREIGFQSAIEMRLSQGEVLKRLNRLDESMEQYGLAIREARAARQFIAISDVHANMGAVEMERRDWKSAQTHLEESFRLRAKYAPLRLSWSLLGMGRLELAQQRPRDAVRLFTDGLRRASVPPIHHLLHFWRARAHLELGHMADAFADLEVALSICRRMRLSLPFSDELQISSEGKLQEIYTLYVEVAAALYEQTGELRYAEQAFDAAQENRAVSLRNRTGAGETWHTRLPDSYWTKLDQLRKEELAKFLLPASAESPELIRLRSELTEIESVAGVEASAPLDSRTDRKRLQGSLVSREALISFHLGNRSSWRWVMDSRGLRMQRLPGKSELAAKIQAFREAVEKDSPAHATLGKQLFELLFSGAPRDAVSLWTIVPDDTLFDLPFAALAVGTSSQGTVYLAEEKTLRLVPTAFFFQHQSPPGRGMLAIGDPISNRADPRWKSGTPVWRKWLMPRKASGPLELARLIGSQQEVEKCLRTWPTGPRRSLEGAAISRAAIRHELAGKPGVLHFATHVYQPAGHTGSPVITLGLNPEGDLQVLTDSEIALLRPAPQWVTISGCGSGRGPLAPGTGLLGLTRAWLMAGAKSVTASLWAVADDDGGMFNEYYQYLSNGRDGSSSYQSAQALQSAQVKIIRKDGGRERPASWSAYFVIGVI